MSSASIIISVLSIAIALLAAWIIQLARTSPIDPLPLVFPPLPTPEFFLFPNGTLQNIDKLGEGLLQSPEDVAVDDQGRIYAGSFDGWVKRMWRNGTWEDWKFIGGSPLGIAVGIHGEVIVCDITRGLLNVSEEGISVLVSEVHGKSLKLINGVAVANNGIIYFTEASDKYPIEQFHWDLLESRPHGRLMQYDPSSGTVIVLLQELGFANGVALSPKQDFLVVCESWRCQCWKYWLEGPKGGTVELFLRLPGNPDNIHLSPDNTFWIAIPELRTPLWDFIHRFSLLKMLSCRSFMHKQLSRIPRGCGALKVGLDGELIYYLSDPQCKFMVTGIMEFGNHLYLGSLTSNYIGHIKLR